MTLPKPSPRGQETAEAPAGITAVTGYWVADLLLQMRTSAETASQPPQLGAEEPPLRLPSTSHAIAFLWQNQKLHLDPGKSKTRNLRLPAPVPRGRE